MPWSGIDEQPALRWAARAASLKDGQAVHRDGHAPDDTGRDPTHRFHPRRDDPLTHHAAQTQ